LSNRIQVFMDQLRLFLFGPPRIEYHGSIIEIKRRKALALGAYLALSERSQSRDALATLLWPDLDQQRARAALRSTLPTLTTLSPQSWIAANRAALTLKREAVWVDVRAFLDLLMQSRSHSHGLETVCAECVPLLEQSVALYRDDFLADFTLPDNVEYDQWQVAQRERLRREFGGVLRRLSHYYAEQNAFGQAIAYAQRWVALDPLHEAAQRMLIRVYATNGQRTEALRQYETCVHLLDTELATPPEDETTRLYQIIKTNGGTSVQTGLTAPSSSGVLPPLPTLIVGREEALHEIEARLGIGGELCPVTVIQGWPGVGKSTTVAALVHNPDIGRAFPDGVLWASLGATPDLLAEILPWADALKLNDPGKTPNLEEIITRLTAVLRDKRMLLIVDDVWQVEHAAPFKVGGRNCALIITSRLNDVAQALAPTPHDVYRLPVLSEEKALNLLGVLSPETLTDHPEEARELMRDLEGLPLAIQVAGRLLYNEARLGWDVSDLLHELRHGANLLEAQAPGDMVGVGRDTTPTIAALLQRSTDLLDDVTRQRFALLGLLVPKPATFDLKAMTAAWDVTDPRPTARILVNRGLLEPISGGRFQMHALLVLHARSLLEA
jgi:DNA-binding SARP family transcriptional activator